MCVFNLFPDVFWQVVFFHLDAFLLEFFQLLFDVLKSLDTKLAGVLGCCMQSLFDGCLIFKEISIVTCEFFLFLLHLLYDLAKEWVFRGTDLNYFELLFLR
jgi:hypothetical protein